MRDSKSVREALQYVSSHPERMGVDPIDTPVWELVGRTLFEIANSPDAKVRGSMARATKAQRMITDRLVGVRRPGTHPVVKREQRISFVDLTAGEIGR